MGWCTHCNKECLVYSDPVTGHICCVTCRNIFTEKGSSGQSSSQRGPAAFESTKSGGITIEEMISMADESSPFQLPTDKLLCKHKDTDAPNFSGGLCKECHDEFIELSGEMQSQIDNLPINEGPEIPTIEEMMAMADESPPFQSLTGKLLCKHKDTDAPIFACGLCKECYDEFIELAEEIQSQIDNRRGNEKQENITFDQDMGKKQEDDGDAGDGLGEDK